MLRVALLFSSLFWTLDSYVTELSDLNFRDVLDNKYAAIVIFFAPWCHHCHETMPEFEKASDLSTLEGSSEYYKVDCDNSGKTLCTILKIPGYPTLKVFHHGLFWMDYNGDRTAHNIYEFFKRFQPLDQKKIQPFESSNGQVDYYNSGNQNYGMEQETSLESGKNRPTYWPATLYTFTGNDQLKYTGSGYYNPETSSGNVLLSSQYRSYANGLGGQNLDKSIQPEPLATTPQLISAYSSDSSSSIPSSYQPSKQSTNYYGYDWGKYFGSSPWLSQPSNDVWTNMFSKPMYQSQFSWPSFYDYSHPSSPYINKYENPSTTYRQMYQSPYPKYQDTSWYRKYMQRPVNTAFNRQGMKYYADGTSGYASGYNPYGGLAASLAGLWQYGYNTNHPYYNRKAYYYGGNGYGSYYGFKPSQLSLAYSSQGKPMYIFNPYSGFNWFNRVASTNAHKKTMPKETTISTLSSLAMIPLTRQFLYPVSGSTTTTRRNGGISQQKSPLHRLNKKINVMKNHSPLSSVTSGRSYEQSEVIQSILNHLKSAAAELPATFPRFQLEG